jgi:hypothetical protein
MAESNNPSGTKIADTKAVRSLVADPERAADDQFLDDLGAVGRFKTFLIGRGRPVSDEVSAGIGKLLTTFVSDLEKYENHTREKEDWKKPAFWSRARIRS